MVNGVHVILHTSIAEEAYQEGWSSGEFEESDQGWLSAGALRVRLRGVAIDHNRDRKMDVREVEQGYRDCSSLHRVKLDACTGRRTRLCVAYFSLSMV
jgi:hypothetical protein